MRQRRRQCAQPADRRPGAADGVAGADRRRHALAAPALLHLPRRPIGRPGAGRARPRARPRGERGLARRRLRARRARRLFPVADRQGNELLPLPPDAWPPLPYPQPPEAGAGRRGAGADRRLQHRGQLFRRRGRWRVARSRDDARWPRRGAAGTLFRRIDRVDEGRGRADPHASTGSSTATARPTARCNGPSAGRRAGCRHGRRRPAATCTIARTSR